MPANDGTKLDPAIAKEFKAGGTTPTRVWLGRDGYVWKQAPKYNIDNEEWGCRTMSLYGYAPQVIARPENDLIVLEYIKADPITCNDREWYFHGHRILDLMIYHKLRHGDLTTYSVVPHNNRPYIIDWAESRYGDDPRTDKRREGDLEWLTKTMKALKGSNP